MNKYLEALGKISPYHFGFSGGCEYIVCVAPYLRTEPIAGFGYIDGYYEVSNSQYHKTQEFMKFCKENGCAVEIEREKSYKDFLFSSGFFGRGKNTLLYDKEFGSKIYFTVLKVAKAPENGENRREFVKFLQILKSKQSRFQSFDDGCGNCKICTEKCPQKAIPCNLENCLRTHMQNGVVTAEISEKLGGRVLGCEICSEVCPKNKNVKKAQNACYPLETLLELACKKDANLCEKYGKNIISKNKLIPFILNAMGNSKDVKYLELLQKYSESENENIRFSASLAIKKLEREKGDKK